MPHSIPENIQLKFPHNKIIRLGKSKKFVTPKDRTLRVSIDGEWLEKPIQVYRMWYRFLQLALELEQQKVSIVSKMESVELKKPKKDKWGKLRYSEMKPIRKNVKVNRKKYSSWDLDLVPSTSFDEWWKGNNRNYPAHRELFIPSSSIAVVKKKDDWVNDKKYTYIRIDNRRRINEIESHLRNYLVTEREKGNIPEFSSVSDYPVHGTPNVNTLINRYNALILQLTSTESDKVMLASNVFRPTKEGMNDATEGAYNYGGSPGRAMRDLMLPAKIALLSVCDGFFPINPNKEYV